MEIYQLRVVEEKEGLDKKIPSLRDFIDNNLFDSLDRDEKERLYLQYQVMQNYSRILGQRIDNF